MTIICRTHIHHVWKSQMSVKKCLVNSRLFGSVILNHILIMCIRSHHRHLRLHLAALHSVANANCKQAETRQGEKRYRLSYPKYKAGHHVVKAVKENCTYDYVDELMAGLLRMKGVQERCQCKGCLWQHSVFTATPVFICKQNPEVRGCAEPSFAI
ncbi:uncharacterized protein LOC127862970 isoform X1 [Dreissena polymorpha]|uniref:uncharacterized protein LOC127862970 isoform X1 n=2 Tax=Dreissena polymorpha TaxID=45954 RepID=UPI002264321C|nr:uncharacterized protein LOC127862970 isoform X1 [Dreissena polymorpha]